MFSRKFVEKIRFWSSLGRSGSSGKSRATGCQNSSLLRRLETTKTSKKRFGKKFIFLGFGNQFFVIFPGFLKESTILGVKINFLVKFCSRYTYSEIRATKNCEKRFVLREPGLREPYLRAPNSISMVCPWFLWGWVWAISE